jgi:hypothetical protein
MLLEILFGLFGLGWIVYTFRKESGNGEFWSVWLSEIGNLDVISPHL